MPWRDNLSPEGAGDEDLIKQRGRVIVLQRLLVAAVAIVLLAVLAIQTFTSITGYLARQELLDCTTPEGKCYAEGQKRTGEAVTSIVDKTIEGAIPLHRDTRHIVTLAAACADREGVQTANQIENCVRKILATEGKHK